VPTASANSGNCNIGIGDDLRAKGSYTGSASPYGTFDQGGNVFEWNEAITSGFTGSDRVYRGGAYIFRADTLAASARSSGSPSDENSFTGFRLALIPEPSTGLLVISGLLGVAGWRRGAR